MIEILLSSYDVFLKATWLTVRITFVSLLLGSVIGLVFAFFRLSKSRVLNAAAKFYITLIRGTPLIIQIAVLYFGISNIILLSQFWAGVFALAIHGGAYIAEIFRGAIQSIDRGQMEAARSLGMTYPQAMRRIILPQAFKIAIPPLGNQFILGLKESSLVAYVGMSDLWGAALSEAASNFKQLETYVVAGLYYLALVMLFTFVVGKLEARLDVNAKAKSREASAKPRARYSSSEETVSL
ncbi:cystine transporter permease [Paenibacillus elgii]|uniref:Cystine transporter permease n=1 Tax=Paenibacillus elgii TaxID=189691 RepID=A0A2T6FS38_9BACL|nr:amino acid ABC transporter permease [Paenibacillus elgii]PUA34724.1 cystine transporter permease [Paenibacillus elgii]